MLRKLLVLFSILFALAVACAGGIYVFAAAQYAARGPLERPVIFLIAQGESVSRISQNLAAANVIRHPYIFQGMARLTNVHTALKAGEYEFQPGETMEQVLGKIVRGDIYHRAFTVPEGLTSWQIVNILNAVPEMEGTVDAVPAEGSLLPETYNYSKNDKRQAALLQMQRAMTRTLDTLWADRDENLPFFSKEEALALASIIEKETGVDAERRRVAGVYVNRLRIGMPLQSDPTVIYALTRGRIDNKGQGPLGRRLLTRDLEYDSPYNTYVYRGLPPGPIANPGRASIEAAVHPEQHDFLFFVADGKGGHVFARTLNEHNQNVINWRRARAQRAKMDEEQRLKAESKARDDTAAQKAPPLDLESLRTAPLPDEP